MLDGSWGIWSEHKKHAFECNQKYAESEITHSKEFMES